MALKVIGCFLAVVCVAAAVPLPQFQAVPTNAAARAIVSQVSTNADPEATAEAVREVLPRVNEALTNEEGSDMERFNRVALAFLPIGRSAIKAQSASASESQIENLVAQQEAAEEVVPVLLDTIKTMVQLFPRQNIPTNFNTQVDLSNVPTFDSPFIPNQVIKGQTIPATQFMPEIVIPDIVIQ